MADKDINERHHISEILGVPLLICLFQALKAFKRELSSLELAKDESTQAKTLFERMCYAHTEQIFQTNES